MSLANVLHVIEAGAKIAAPFSPPPYNSILGIVGNLANDTQTQAQAQGVQIPDINALMALVPPEVIAKILAGQKVTIEIDGGKIRDAFGKATSELGSAFKIK